MKKLGFLHDLKEDRKLELVEPSHEICEAYQKKSGSYFISAKILLENNHLEESFSMAYYSMYYMLTALLFMTGIKCENHSASIILLKKIYSIDNSKISHAKKERIDKQYYIDFRITRDDAEDIIRIAEEFNTEIIDFISRLNAGKIEDYRAKITDI